MRSIIVASTAAIVVGLFTPAASLAQTTRQTPPRAESNRYSFNQCADLASARGWNWESDLYDGPGAMAFVKRCMEGKQR